MLFLKVALWKHSEDSKAQQSSKGQAMIRLESKNDKYSKGLNVKYVLSKRATFSIEGVRVVHPVVTP